MLTKPTEPNELTKARTLLGRFETEMHRPEGLVHLSEALSLLADIRAGSASEQVKQVALNLSLLYANKIQVQIELLLSREPSIHWTIFEHWKKILDEFECSGFELSQDVAETRKKLRMREVNKEIRLLSPSEHEQLVRLLQETDDK